MDAEVQQVEGIQIQHWRDQEGSFGVEDIADIVIEFFACDIPPQYMATMARCSPHPVWFNFEGLTAEEWVEGCHTLPSSHPRLPLTKYFFFPGFTPKTGGLLREAALEQQRLVFDVDAQAKFLAGLGLTTNELASFKISLFCYPQAPVAAVFNAWQCGDRAVTCLVPEGVAREQVESFLGRAAVAGSVATKGALTVRVLPFVPQPQYDQLLWACDFNFVRGEDSFVRAQWAGKPFIWHIYPQDENLHLKKLRAFLQRYVPGIKSVNVSSLGWNGALSEPVDWRVVWQEVFNNLEEIESRSQEWRRQIEANGDFTSNLLKFAAQVRGLAGDLG